MTQVISTNSIKQGKVPQFAWVRVISCFAIIILHTLYASSLALKPADGVSISFVAEAWQNNLMWAVPCFLMTTGALLLNPDKTIGLKKIYSKYIKRIVLTLLFFTFVFATLDPIMAGKKFSLASVAGNWIRNVITDGSWAHMWYLYLLIGIYVMLPVYRAVINYCTDAQIKYLCSVLIFFISVLPMTELFGIKTGFYLCTTLIYPVYPLLGYAIYNKKINISKLNALILLIGCTVSIVVLTNFGRNYADLCFDQNSLTLFNEFFGYASIFVIGQGVGIYSFICSLNCSRKEEKLAEELQDWTEAKHATKEDFWGPGDKKKKNAIPNKRLFDIDKCTFGIYLIHMILLKYVLLCKGFNPLSFTGVKMVGSVLLMSICFFVISLYITKVLRKIPGIRSFL